MVSSVNLNHATPAAFYAHQASRNDYYEIGLELVDSGFEYFAGGGLKKVTGADKDKTSLYDLAEAAAYKVTYTQADAEAVTADDSKVILIDEHLADSDAMDYEMDRVDGEWALSDYAAKEHPEETLILVTGDHETGGLTIGFAGTDYDTYLDTLTNQKISYAQFDEQYMASYKENLTSFEDAMKDVEALFGLKMVGEENDRLVLTEYEIQRLRTAYDLSMTDYNVDEFTQEQYVLYGEYNPFSVTVTHILNNKSGVDFTSYSHTGLPVAVFADGIGAEAFSGYYDNTEIYNRLAAMLGIN